MSDGRLSTPVLVAPHVAAVILLRQVPVLEWWRVVARSPRPPSFCSQMSVTHAEARVVGSGCSQHAAALTICCESSGLVETLAACAGAMLELKSSAAAHLHFWRLSRSIQTRVGILN